MGVKQVKNSMYKLNTEISTTLNSLNNLISLLNGVTKSTSNLVASPSSRLKMNLSMLESDIKFLHNMTGVELHILFREYNRLLSKTITDINRLETSLNELIVDSKELYMLYMIDMAMGGFLEYNMSEQDLKKHIPDLNQFRTILNKLQLDTKTNNSKLIIKNNRG
jgi:hypothetical protein